MHYECPFLHQELAWWTFLVRGIVKFQFKFGKFKKLTFNEWFIPSEVFVVIPRNCNGMLFSTKTNFATASKLEHCLFIFGFLLRKRKGKSLLWILEIGYETLDDVKYLLVLSLIFNLLIESIKVFFFPSNFWRSFFLKKKKKILKKNNCSKLNKKKLVHHIPLT